MFLPVDSGQCRIIRSDNEAGYGEAESDVRQDAVFYLKGGSLKALSLRL